MIRFLLQYLLSVFCLSIALAQQVAAESTDIECKYPDTLESFFIPPDRRLGDYRLELAPPDFANRVSIQQHLKHSAIYASLLADYLSKTTNGLCSAAASPASYPDMLLSLTRSASSSSVESDRSECLLAVLAAAKQIQPTESEISAAALHVVKKTVQWLAPAAVVSEALADAYDALASIYTESSVLAAFLSVRPSDLLSVKSSDFIAWLTRQKAARREALIPVPLCQAGTEPQSPWRAKRGIDLQSAVIPPGTIKVFANRKEVVRRRPLFRLVLFGLSRGRVAEQASMLCENQTVKAPRDEDAPPVSVPINCVRLGPAHADWWIAFYCDPANCTSEFQERIALDEIAKSAGIIKVLGTGSNDAPERGPYIVELIAAATCKETVERFIHDLDGLMSQNPRSLDRYNALLNWYFPPKTKFSSASATSSTVAGCDVDQLIQVVKQSRFLYEIGKAPQYRNPRFEFRGILTKVYFSVDRDTGGVFGTGVWWIQPYP